MEGVMDRVMDGPNGLGTTAFGLAALGLTAPGTAGAPTVALG